jgi:hypothetical protein
MPQPEKVTPRHEEPSLLMSLYDETYQPSNWLLDLAAAVVSRVVTMTQMPNIAHPILSNRIGPGPKWYNYPGEHYHLLNALCSVLRPIVVWEFGTGTGMSAVAMLEGWCASHIYTFDIKPDKLSWIDNGDTQINRYFGDMAHPDIFRGMYGMVMSDQIVPADLIFVDGPKDGYTETKFIETLDATKFLSPPIVVFDDIRLMPMVHVWRSIKHPKMDLTSFGHWSGTGIVEWV